MMTAATRRLVPALLLLVLALLPASPVLAADKGAKAEKVAPPPVAWRNFREARTEARHADRPLLVFFSAAWKATSVRMDRETWNDLAVRQYLDGNIVASAIDMQDMPSVAKQFGIAEPPAILLLAPDGTQLVLLRGFHGPETVLRVCQFAATGAWKNSDYETWLSHNKPR